MNFSFKKGQFEAVMSNKKSYNVLQKYDNVGITFMVCSIV